MSPLGDTANVAGKCKLLSGMRGEEVADERRGLQSTAVEEVEGGIAAAPGVAQPIDQTQGGHQAPPGFEVCECGGIACAALHGGRNRG